MLQSYHISLSAGDEVMFRQPSDFVRAVNCFAVACLETDSVALADGFMSNHYHLGVRTAAPDALMEKMRYQYSRYFNGKYGRKGRLGERQCFTLPLDGHKHMLAAFSYIMRQALHHGAGETPFSWKYGSANALFRKELGRPEPVGILEKSAHYQFLPGRYVLPSYYRMDLDGMILQQDFIDTGYMQELYLSPRNFLYYMNRLSDDDWAKDQQEEKSQCPVITLETIEHLKEKDQKEVAQMKLLEKGRLDKKWMTDLELCAFIDQEIVPRLLGGNDGSLYQLSPSRRRELGNALWQAQRYRQPISFSSAKSLRSVQWEKLFTVNQLRRCLVIPPIPQK